MLSVKFRSFKAIDEPDSCEKFLIGHRKVLEIYDIKMITSNKDNWTTHDNTYVVLVESLDGKVLGGARLQIADDKLPLPIEEAIGTLDPKIFEFINQHKVFKTGEICGLWNSREIAGYGVGSIYLTRACISIAYHKNLTSLFGLCAPATVNVCLKVGYIIERSLGSDGFFNYPKLNLVATAMIIDDVKTLKHASSEHRKKIFSLINNQNLKQIEDGRKGQIEIEYNLEPNNKPKITE